MKKHARAALRVARQIAQEAGHDVVFLGHTGGDHLRFAVVAQAGQEVGRFTLSESPKCPSDAPNIARQLTRRVLREARV